MTNFIFYWNDTETAQVGIEFYTQVDGYGYATIKIAAFEATDLATWVGRQYQDIEIRYGTAVYFNGFIELVGFANNIISLTCAEFTKKLEWNALSADEANFVIDEGKVNGDPTDTTLDVLDYEGNAVGWSAHAYQKNDYKQYYIIVSDTTNSQSTQIFKNGANNYVGHAGATDLTDLDGDYTHVNDAAIGDADFWEGRADLGTVDSGYFRISLNAGSYSIGLSNTIKKIYIQGSAKVGILESNNYVWIEWNLYQSPGTDAGEKKFIAGGYIKHAASLNFETYVITFNKEIDVIDDEDYFDPQGGSYWEGGYIWLELGVPVKNGSTSDLYCYWDSLYYKIDYESAAFSPINAIITDNGTSSLTAEDENGTPISFYESGVANGDTWVIAQDYRDVFDKVGKGSLGLEFTPNINANNNFLIYKGFGKRYNSIGSKELFDELVENIQYTWYADYLDNIISLKTHERITTEYINYGSNITNFDFASNITYGNVTYGIIIVIWTEGYAKAIGDTNSLQLLRVVKTDIRSQTEAQDYANELAANQTLQPSLKTGWNTFKTCRAGNIATVSLYGIDYTNLIAKKVSYTQNGINITTKIEWGGIK